MPKDHATTMYVPYGSCIILRRLICSCKSINFVNMHATHIIFSMYGLNMKNPCHLATWSTPSQSQAKRPWRSKITNLMVIMCAYSQSYYIHVGGGIGFIVDAAFPLISKEETAKYINYCTCRESAQTYLVSRTIPL